MGLFKRTPKPLFENKQVTSRQIAMMIAAFAVVPINTESEDPVLSEELNDLVKTCKRIQAEADAFYYNYPNN